MTQPQRRAAPSKASPLGGSVLHGVKSVGANRLWLVRHAQPLIAPGICYGQLNVAASAEATRACAAELAEVLPTGTSVVTSSLQRCEQLTYVLIGLRPDLTLKIDPNLQEMHFGNWEGRAWADIAKTELDDWTENFAHYPAGNIGGGGGGISGESVSQFMARVATAFDAIDPAQNTLWVTHAGVIRAVQLFASGVRHITRADQWPADAPAYGQWCKLDS